MGFKFTVSYWSPDDGDDLIYWEGSELEDAIEKMFELKQQGKRCINLIWRP